MKQPEESGGSVEAYWGEVKPSTEDYANGVILEWLGKYYALFINGKAVKLRKETSDT